jgi:2OG-Fe(II) oxygenase superfamily
VIGVGEPAPWFLAARDAGEMVHFDELGGRYLVLFFFGRAVPPVVEVLVEIERCPLFDGDRALCVAVGNRRKDFSKGALPQSRAGHLYLLDGQGHGARRYGLNLPVQPVAFILSPALQVIDVVALNDPSVFAAHIRSTLTSLLTNNDWERNAPVLIVPQVFDRPLCERLINLYDEAGGREIGAIEREGEALKRFNPEFRKRLDYYVVDEPTVIRCRELLATRLLPLVFRAFQFTTTRIERWLVGCYDAKTGGYFRPHRDNTVAMLAHRRFAVTINLNDGYDGGDLVFPEYGRKTYRAAIGEAIVFSCSLLHEVTPVTRDRRYAFLSFLYDEAGEKMRVESSANLDRWRAQHHSEESHDRNAGGILNTSSATGGR